MFKQIISHSPLVSEAANEVFQNITGSAYRSDITFLATLRALVAPRMKKEDRINLSFTRSSYSSADIAARSDDILEEICRAAYVGECNEFVVHSLASDHESNLQCMNMLRSMLPEKYSGYSHVEKMAVFFAKSFPVVCFSNPEKNSVIFFVDMLDVKKMHYLQMAILPALPWYFDPKDGLSEPEMNLVQSLREPSSDQYIACIDRIAEGYDFRTARLKKLLAGFETRYEHMEIDNLRNAIANVDQQIDSYNMSIGTLLKQRREHCVRLLGLETKSKDDPEESEIQEYFICNRKLHLERVDDSSMTFVVADHLSYYDQEMIENMINNKRGYIYSCHKGNISEADMTMLIRAIFLEERLKLRTCAAYQFDMRGNVRAQSGYDFPEELVSYLPNPHINDYRCMGGYESTINTLLRKCDYVGAIEQCVASAKSLNWGDSSVMNKFMARMYESNRACIELPDGRCVNSKEAIKWLSEQEAKTDG